MIKNKESMTAKVCSFIRAYHSNYQKHKIFDDYLAYDMMGKEEYDEIKELLEQEFEVYGINSAEDLGERQLRALLDQYVSPVPLSRIAFAEDELRHFSKMHGKSQYVICGAGMDTFAFRNENPNIQIFELDHPDTQRYKIEKIKELEWIVPDNVHYVSIDFSTDDLVEVLEKAGFDAKIPTFTSILGVTYYLTLSVFEQTIEKIAALSGANNKIVFDFPDEMTFHPDAPVRVQLLSRMTEKLGEPMAQGFSFESIKEALGRHSFDVDEHLSPEKIQAAYFDGRIDGQRAFENVHFITAIKKEKKTVKQTIFTSESVTEGHPDKVCDIISDSILDAYLREDPYSRVAVETVVKNNTVIVVGEISSSAKINTDSVIRQAINEIGYNRFDLGFNSDTAELILRLDTQSPDIAQGVNQSIETRGTGEETEIGAGDQGMVFGYACDETTEYMPLPLSLAHRLAKQLTKVRKDGTLPYLRPDGKTQVSAIYEDNALVGLDTVVVSAQHNPDIEQNRLREDIIRYVVKPVIPEGWLTEKTKMYINPTGRFVIGGPVGDSGLTGRKIIVDTYGGSAAHGGGAFSGKDPTKVDRSAAYAARYLAKNIVAAKLARRVEIQIAYAIGVASPVSVNINTFGTGAVSDEKLKDAVITLFDLRPGALIRNFNLQRPIYTQTAAYGHFGRDDLNVPWEKTDFAQKLVEYLEGKV